MLKHLASGGMAEVVLARSSGIEGFERHVVLKRIRAELARDPRFVRMFLDEARVVATLHHQNIVQVHDIGEVDGEYFIAMEYVHGEDVRKILSHAARQHSHVPLGYAVAIVSAAAAGLHYAHERCASDRQPLNIVHRDVSPSNILVGHDGSIKVVDFGIASASMREETRSGSLKGKLSYMSPEQCKGLSVDRRSDVYGLGVVLYELATTTPMIRGESDYMVMEAIVHGRIPPPQSRRAGLPGELQDIIMRALSTDRAQRYDTADELRIALDHFAASAGLTASTSAIAAYMRKQFGAPLEPWLELDQGSDDDSPYAEESRVTIAIEQPSEGSARRARAGEIAAPPVAASAPAAPIGTAVMAVATPPQSVPIPTDSRMGWESLARVSRSRASRLRTIAVAAGTVVAGLAIWLATRGDDKPAHAPQAAAHVAAVAPAPASVPTPAPVARTQEPVAPVVDAAQAPPPAAQQVAAAAANPPEVAPRRDAAAQVAAATRSDHAEPAQRKSRTGAATRPTMRSGLDSAPATSGRSDVPARVAVGSTMPETGAPEPAVERPAPAVAAPAPAPVAPPPVVVATAPAAQANDGPQVVTPPVLDANRISGDRRIIPDETTMTAIGRANSETITSLFKVCVATDGHIQAVTQLRSSGFPAYDAKIQTTIQRDWRYRPYLVNGKAVPVCTAFKFVYAQK